MGNVGAIELQCPMCGTVEPRIEECRGQHVARCPHCSTYLKNVPKADLGLGTRSVTSRKGVKPRTRSKVLDRFGHSCISCGRIAGDVVLHIDHIIPVQLAKDHGFYDDLIESEWNLAPGCEECNLGKGEVVFSARTVALMYRALVLASKAPAE